MDSIIVKHANKHNLKDVSIAIPMNKMTSFIGKSGSGKSTLAVDVIFESTMFPNDNVIVPGEVAIFRQTAYMQNKKCLVGSYLFNSNKIDDNIKLSDSLPNYTVGRFFNNKSLKTMAKMLGIDKLKLNVPVESLSLTVYNKIRFFRLLLSKRKYSILIVDELSVALTDNNAKEIGKLFQYIVSKGLTVLAIEHSLPIISFSDYIVEMGPDAGVHGGEVIYSGSFEEYKKTQRWKDIIKESKKKLQHRVDFKKQITIQNINFNCLSKLDVSFPLNCIVNVCGNSSSGKTSLLDIIYRALDKSSNAWNRRQGIDGEVLGKQYMRRVHIIDQSPIGKNIMSTPATYVGIMDGLRELYFNICENEKLPYKYGDFSYQADYKCKKCNGTGYFKNDYDDNSFLIPCDECDGMRFEKEILSVKFDGLSIGEILQTPCDELLKHFTKEKVKKSYANKIEFLKMVGLSYLCLGQPSGTLSGGESQRIKITKELAKKLGDRSIFILDGPSRGLHVFNYADIFDVLRVLVKKNNSIIISDNAPFFIRNSDFVILLEEGRILHQGPPDKIPVEFKKRLGL